MRMRTTKSSRRLLWRALRNEVSQVAHRRPARLCPRRRRNHAASLPGLDARLRLPWERRNRRNLTSGDILDEGGQRMKRKYIDVARAAILYERMGALDVGKILGCSGATVLKRLHHAGVEARPRGFSVQYALARQV